jgi:trigger factor
MTEQDEARIEREFEDAVLDAAVEQSRVEVPQQLVHARAHELLHDTMAALERSGISKEAYLRISGKDEESLAHEAEPEAEKALKREAVLAAVVVAEQIDPTDEDLLAALAPSAEREHSTSEKLLQRLRSNGRLERLREDVAARQARELLVSEARPISVEQAKARDKLWTPEKSGAEKGSGQLWTPGARASE